MTVELLLPETGIGEVAMILRCHRSITDRLRTRNLGGRILAAANISPDFLTFKRGRRRNPGAGFAHAAPRLSGQEFRFYASSISGRYGFVDANSISKNHDDPLVCCIDAERAAT